MPGGERQRGVQFGLPHHPEPARGGCEGKKRDPPVSVRCRERGASGVGRLARSQDLESADSTKVVTCAVFALPPSSDFPPQQLPRNSVGAVIPLPLPCL